MKTLSIILFASIIIFTTTSSSCKKHKDNPVVDKGCGCTTDSISYTPVNWVGTLGYLNNQYQQAWFVNIKFPNNAAWLCKVCNLDKAQSIINTITTNDTVSVKFSGKLRPFCSDEYIGIYTGIVVPYHLTIDSLKRN